MRSIHRAIGVTMTLAFLLTLMAVPTLATEQEDEDPAQHCPNHQAEYPSPYGKQGDSGDMDVDGVSIAWDGDTVTITNENDTEATIVWCAKGGSGFNEYLDPADYDTPTYNTISQSIGEQTTVLGPDASFEGSYGTGISYFMLYSVNVEDEEPGGEEPGGEEPTGEGCPATTTLLVTFSWNGGYTADAPGSGVSVAGDNHTAYWASSQIISAIVVTAGGETRHITLDMPETTGSISPHNYEVFGGGTIASLGFCVGPKVNPDSGSGASVELVKTASCAIRNADGTATVTGAIEVDNHDRRTARITSALDTILGPNDQALARTTISALVGMVLVEDEVVTVPYEITFDPQDFDAFDNFIEVTIERADNGAARHKIYNDRAAFELCDGGEQPEESGELTVMKFYCDGEAVGVAFFVNDPEAPIEGCEPGEAMLTLNPTGDVLNVDGSMTLELDAGTYSLTETAPNAGTSSSFDVVAGEETTVVVINTTVDDEQGGNPTPTPDGDTDGDSSEETTRPTPREDTQGGLPDTAMAGTGWLTAALAVTMLGALGVFGIATVAARRRI